MFQVSAVRAMLLQVKETETEVARRLLGHLVRESEGMQMVDEEDGRMEGKLRLLMEVVQVLDSRCVGSQGAGGLVHRIITGAFLFQRARKRASVRVRAGLVDVIFDGESLPQEHQVSRGFQGPQSWKFMAVLVFC